MSMSAMEQTLICIAGRLAWQHGGARHRAHKHLEGTQVWVLKGKAECHVCLLSCLHQGAAHDQQEKTMGL